MDLNKHIVTDDTGIFHSSGLARVANGNRIGSVSTMSFEQRQQIEQNRQKVAGYNRSSIGRTCGALRAKPIIGTNAIGSRVILSQRPVQPVSTSPDRSQRYSSFS